MFWWKGGVRMLEALKAALVSRAPVKLNVELAPGLTITHAVLYPVFHRGKGGTTIANVMLIVGGRWPIYGWRLWHGSSGLVLLPPGVRGKNGWSATVRPPLADRQKLV